MNLATDTHRICLLPKAGGVRCTFKPVLKLAAAIAAVLFFMLWLGPKMESAPFFQPMAEFIEERGIEANMYFYTEVEAFSEANINMDNTMKYPPHGPGRNGR